MMHYESTVIPVETTTTETTTTTPAVTVIELDYKTRLQSISTVILADLLARYSTSTNITTTQMTSNAAKALSAAKILLDLIEKEPVR